LAEGVLKNFLLLQSILEAVLLVFLAAVLWRTRKSRPAARPEDQPLPLPAPAILPDEIRQSLERFLTEAEKLSKTFEASLKDKKELTADLILKLDRRLNDYQALLAKTEEAVRDVQDKLADLNQGDPMILAGGESQQANPAAPEVRAMDLKLAEKGLSVEEIAVRSKLHRGEVELIIDLENQFRVQ
jgi:hypothetical protein